MVFDTSSLVELALGSRSGMALSKKLGDSSINGHVTEIGICELSYVLCRREGFERSHKRVQDLLDSGYVQTASITDLIDLAAELKCERAISLADCFALALAKKLGLPLLFASRELEIEREMAKKKFDVELIFLEDFASG